MQAVAFIDALAHPAAQDFYQWCKIEPVTFGGTVIDWLYVRNARKYTLPSISTLVGDMLVYLNPGDSVIFVCHGNDHTLSLPLARKCTLNLTTTAARTINNHLAGIDGRPEKEIAKALKFKDVVDFQTLCDYLIEVRKKQLNHVALRACKLGIQNVDLLKELKTLFNCRSLSGPVIKDSYIDWNTNQVSGSTADFEKVINDPRRGQLQVFNASPNRVAFHVSATAKQRAEHKFALSSLAETREAVRHFIDCAFYTFAGTQLPYKFGQTIPIHAFYWEGNLFFPREPQYHNLLATYPIYTPIELSFIYNWDTKKPRLLERIKERIRGWRQAR